MTLRIGIGIIEPRGELTHRRTLAVDPDKTLTVTEGLE